MVPGGMPPPQQQQAEQQAKAQQQEEMRKELLQKVLTPEALERLHRIGLVKADKARKLEDMVLMMAQKGQVQSQITDSYMKQMLEGISDGEDKTKSGISFDRRRFGDESDDEDLLDGL